jgi:hypothetical protein
MAINKDFVKKAYAAHKEVLAHNHTLYDIWDGNLMQYILADLALQFSPKAFNQIKNRIIPINVLKRIVDKLSKVYGEAPDRKGKDESSKKAISYYEKALDINTVMGESCAFFNLFKNTTVEPFIHKGKPKLRSVSSDKSVWLSDDAVDPTSPTHWVKVMGKHDQLGDILYVYTDKEFVIMTESGEELEEQMAAIGNQGVNEYGAIPAIYINRSRHSICPTPDTSLLTMTKQIPILLSDLDFAIMYQSFSILYGIDIDLANVEFSPNAIWDLKSSNNSDKTPQLGTIKPTVDITETMKFILDVFGLWMQTMNIRAAASGAGHDTLASGFSKVVDELDTSSERTAQVPYFKDAEKRLWNLIANHMQPVWLRVQGFEPEARLPENVDVEADFPEQKPDVDDSTRIDNAIKKLDKGLTTRKRAIKEADPELTDKDVEEILAEEAPQDPAAANMSDAQSEEPADATAPANESAKPTLQ